MFPLNVKKIPVRSVPDTTKLTLTHEFTSIKLLFVYPTKTELNYMIFVTHQTFFSLTSIQASFESKANTGLLDP